eukprot:m.9151 g.9151  ORF g.9151 m.9151 type:complete len:242 (+) comp5352_c0_seq1:2-727(+)
MAAQTVKRFYKLVDVLALPSGRFAVTLDGRRTKTPQGKIVEIPNGDLAQAVAAEWDSQKGTVVRNTMHLTSLCNTAIDRPPMVMESQTPKTLLEFLHTDTLCYRSAEPASLAELQTAEWSPLVQWWEQTFQAPLMVTESLFGPRQSAQAVAAATKYIEGFGWGRAGLGMCVDVLRSFVLASALIEGRIDAGTAVRLARLETEFQIQRFGEVEWAHPIDRAGTTSRTAAAAFFARCTRTVPE